MHADVTFDKTMFAFTRSNCGCIAGQTGCCCFHVFFFQGAKNGQGDTRAEGITAPTGQLLQRQTDSSSCARRSEYVLP